MELPKLKLEVIQMSTIDRINDMPITWTKEYGWELFDMYSGEILPVPDYNSGMHLRNLAIQTDKVPGDLARVIGYNR